MIRRSSKVHKYAARDYAKTIFTFFLYYVVTLAIVGLMFFFSEKANFLTYVLENVLKLTYLSIMLLLMTIVIYLYFYYEERNYLNSVKNITLIFTIIDVTILICFFTGYYATVYIRPVITGALLALMLINKRSAIFINTVVIMFIFLIDTFGSGAISGNGDYASLLIGIPCGTLAIYFVDRVRSRFKVLMVGFILIVPVFVVTLFLQRDSGASIGEIILSSSACALGSVVLYSALLPIFEQIFNVYTDYRLDEISSTSAPLIKRLSIEAPGTYSHSIMVSNMAESCATAIGESPQFARAAAYYHDVGKLRQPEYFSENSTGKVSLHDQIAPELSTDIIRSHTRFGHDLILEERLPVELADIAVQHHGTMPIRYFYMKAKKYTDDDVDMEDYSYHGDKPQTKTAAIIMIVDGCEAKVRTLSDRSHKNVDSAVSDIIEERMDLGQFDECDLKMKDFDIIRRTLVNGLTGAFHDRVKYPRLKIFKRKD